MVAGSVVDGVSVPPTSAEFRDLLERTVRDAAASAFSLRVLLRLVARALPSLQALPNLIDLTERAEAIKGGSRVVIFGPVRAHAVDLASVLLTVLPSTWPSPQAGASVSFVFLGDYIDGGSQSVETLCILLLLYLLDPSRVVLLKGRHELLYPVPRTWTGVDVSCGRLDSQLSLLCQQEAVRPFEGSSNPLLRTVSPETKMNALFEEVSTRLRDLFAALPIACVVDSKFFCACGGIAPDIRKPSDVNTKIPSRNILSPTFHSSTRSISPKPPSPERQADPQRSTPPPATLPPSTHVSAPSSDVEPETAPSEHSSCPERLDAETEQSKTLSSIGNVVLADPMDDDDEYSLHDVLFACNCERESAFTYSFDAACRFLEENSLTMMIRANSYVSTREIDPQRVNSCGRPWCYQYSPCDSGYRLYRRSPRTGVPSVLSLFSAPSFCSTNFNFGAIAVIERKAATQQSPATNDETTKMTIPPVARSVAAFQHVLHIQQFTASPCRPPQLPGANANAFAWSFPFLVKGLSRALQVIMAEADESDLLMAGHKVRPAATTGPASRLDSHPQLAKEMEKMDVVGRVRRFRRLCQTLQRNGVSLSEYSATILPAPRTSPADDQNSEAAAASAEAAPLTATSGTSIASGSVESLQRTLFSDL